MTDVIHLKNEDITKELFDRAQFIFWADDGAMGSSGAIVLVDDCGKYYYCNWLYGDSGYIADYMLIMRACPMFRDGFNEEWVYHYLGFGNRLAYRKEYDEEYCRLLAELVPSQYEIEYKAWRSIAVRLCSNW